MSASISRFVHSGAACTRTEGWEVLPNGQSRSLDQYLFAKTPPHKYVSYAMREFSRLARRPVRHGKKPSDIALSHGKCLLYRSVTDAL